jgi:2',3'-cyclic-nucleotide 2'-phosphodiesterase (5'-nucleotidase family)
MLENGVSAMPAVNGKFAQVSGLCFTYNIEAPAGSRVTKAVRQTDGTCTDVPVDLTAASTYTIAENDFMASGGDGYPNVSAKATTQEIMDQVAAEHISDAGAISPSIQGRIVCTDPNPGSGTNCPVVTP